MSYEDIPAGCYDASHWLIAQNKDPLPDPLSKLVMDGLSFQDIKDYMKDGYSIDEIAAMVKDCKAMGAPITDPEPGAHTEATKPKLIRACDVPYEPPRWTLAPYFQRGKGTLVQGDNGTGKTAFLCAIAAHVTTGTPLLGLPVDAPGDVVILSVEDDLPVLRGRIEADGGDLTKCHFMANAAGLTFTSPEIEAAVKEVKAAMIIFDPIQAFMGASVDMFRANETRPELAKLFEMCDRNDCSCAIVSHMGKAGDKSPVNLITDRPGGGFWSYSDVKSEGAKILGFPPFGSPNDLRQRLDNGLAREMQANDGLIVTHSQRGPHNIHGIRIEQYRHPQGYQTRPKIAEG